MADLGERGQILLVAAFALAVTFVALALVVNSAIFTENLASRGETGGSDTALTLRHEVEGSVGRTIEYANVHNTSTDTELRGAVEDGTDNTTLTIERQHATDGAFVNVSWDPSAAGARTMGSRIAQNDSSQRAFTSGAPTPSAEWLVVDDVSRDTAHTNGTRAFRVNASSLPSSSGSAFTVVVNTTAATDVTWEMELWDDGSTVHVRVDSPNVPGATGPECTAPSTPGSVELHVTRGTLEGEPCDALRWADANGDGTYENYRFGAGVPGPYNVTFENGDQIAGNYSLVTTNTSIGNANLLNHGAGSASPYGTDAVYAVVVDYRYDSPKLHYETQVRVAPEENP